MGEIRRLSEQRYIDDYAPLPVRPVAGIPGAAPISASGSAWRPSFILSRPGRRRGRWLREISTAATDELRVGCSTGVRKEHPKL
jgi:hypothetical protein